MASGYGFLVIVDIDNAALGCRVAQYLMDIRRRRYPGSDVNELPDTGCRELGDRSPQELSVVQGQVRHKRAERRHLGGKQPVNGVVVGTTQVVVIEASSTSFLRADRARVVGHGILQVGCRSP